MKNLESGAVLKKVGNKLLDDVDELKLDLLEIEKAEEMTRPGTWANPNDEQLSKNREIHENSEVSEASYHCPHPQIHS